ncbi:hypothetical protein [Natrononativus amylolyticus]|uniref:hypothetical protein n=1 Tax=Natrononativus amylolyticus TaxID=2963434 RepID=UPI0020CC51BF|nr:hypothetical protein [Natrononativus amylolyticus]
MTPTSTTHETVADAPPANDVLLERSGSYYSYLGEDSKGHHHHVDEQTNTIYVTDDRAERFLPDNAGLYWFRVTGEAHHVEDLSQYDDRDLEEWIAYVDAKRGWEERPPAIGEIVADVIRGGV